MGFCLGLALWTNPLALAFAVPAALWLCLRIRAAGAVSAGLAGVVVGAAPWLYATAKSHLQTLHRVPGTPSSPLSGYLHVFTQIVPAAAGFAPTSPQGRAIGIAALVTVLLGTSVALWRRNPTILVLGLSALLLPAIIVASAEQVVPAASRYTAYLVPALAAVVAWALSRVPLVGVLPVLLVSSWTITTVWNSTNGLAAVTDPAVGRPVAALAARLERMGRTAVWADYWISYLLSAASQERVVAADLSPRREESYSVRAAQAPQTTVVLYPGMTNEQTLRALPGLPRHTRTLVGPFVVWAFDTRVDVGHHLLASY
jgi:hypothetical protein